MKNKNVSDPVILEVFRVLQSRNVIDTQTQQWDGVALLQKAMLTYEPDNYQPIVLIKITEDAPLIRTKIEELDIEEWQNTTALFAEVWNLDKGTKSAVNAEAPLNRSISIDTKTGKLIGVALTGKEIPESFSAEWLKKAFGRNLFKRPIVIHQVPIPVRKPVVSDQATGKSTQELMAAIQTYLLQTIQSDTESGEIETERISSAFKRLNETVFRDRESSTENAADYRPFLSKKKNQGAKPSFINRTDNQSGLESQQYRAIKTMKTDDNGPLAVTRDIQLLKEIPVKEVDSPNGSETEEVAWLKPAGPLKWKQRKKRDYIIVDLAERMIRLFKNKDTPSKEMIVSFLASLSKMQFDFMEKLIDGFTAKNESPNDIPGKDNWETEKKEAGENPNVNPSVVDEAAPQPELPADKEKVSEQPEEDQDPSAPEPEDTDPSFQKKSPPAQERVVADLEMEDFSDISEEEKDLHLKIVDYQKKHNVSYDHAASMVLK